MGILLRQMKVCKELYINLQISSNIFWFTSEYEGILPYYKLYVLCFYVGAGTAVS